jgi:hypothetical protein
MPAPTPNRFMIQLLAAETEAFQALLEAHRALPDNDDLYADMLKAKAAMEVAWLEATATGE